MLINAVFKAKYADANFKVLTRGARPALHKELERKQLKYVTLYRASTARKETFSSCVRELWPVTLNFEQDIDRSWRTSLPSQPTWVKGRLVQKSFWTPPHTHSGIWKLMTLHTAPRNILPVAFSWPFERSTTVFWCNTAKLPSRTELTPLNWETLSPAKPVSTWHRLVTF